MSEPLDRLRQRLWQWQKVLRTGLPVDRLKFADNAIAALKEQISKHRPTND